MVIYYQLHPLKLPLTFGLSPEKRCHEKVRLHTSIIDPKLPLGERLLFDLTAHRRS